MESYSICLSGGSYAPHYITNAAQQYLDEIQSLYSEIDEECQKIREKANAEAAAVIQQAKMEAASILAQAQMDADAILENKRNQQSMETELEEIISEYGDDSLCEE